MPTRRVGELEKAVKSAVSGLSLLPQDSAAVELAITYARSVDSLQEPVSKSGPPLLAVLEALGMTPRGRTALLRGAKSSEQQPAGDPIDELRQRRARRSTG